MFIFQLITFSFRNPILTGFLTVEWVCAYLETRCDDHQSCLRHIAQLKNTTIRNSNRHYDKFGVYTTSHRHGYNHLMRVKNNDLYYDWPWGRSRMSYYAEAKSNGSKPLRVDDVDDKYFDNVILLNVLRILRVNDSLFFMGGERASLPWLFPFPSFSLAPKVRDLLCRHSYMYIPSNSLSSMF